MFTVNIFGSETDTMSLTHLVILVLVAGATLIKKA